MGSLPLWTILSHVPRLMTMIACHQKPRRGLGLESRRPVLKSPWNRSLPLLSLIRRRLILLPLSTSTHIPDAPCVIYSPSNGQGCPNHRVPSSHVCRRMMCLKPLKVTHFSLAHRCTSPCNGNSHRARLCNNGNYSTRILSN